MTQSLGQCQSIVQGGQTGTGRDVDSANSGTPSIVHW